jgi:predicted  nucleic acid-binding Zn-ribbon protein
MIEQEKLKKRSRQGALISTLGFVIIVMGFLFASWKLKDLNNEIGDKSYELDSIMDEVGNKRTDVIEITERFDSLEKENTSLEEKLLDKNTKIESLNIRVNTLHDQSETLKKDIGRQRNTIHVLNHNLEVKKVSLDSLKKEAISARTELTIQKDSIQKLEKNAENLAIQIKELNSEKLALNAFLDNYVSKEENRLTPRASSAGHSGNYQFKIWIDGPDNLLLKIDSVMYFFNHSSFRNPKVVVHNSQEGFETGYLGWGCLENMPISVYYKSGKQETLVLKMCDYLNSRLDEEDEIGPKGEIIPSKGRIPTRGEIPGK